MKEGQSVFYISEGSVWNGVFIRYDDAKHNRCLVKSLFGEVLISSSHVFETREEAYDYIEAENNHNGKGELE